MILVDQNVKCRRCGIDFSSNFRHGKIGLEMVDEASIVGRPTFSLIAFHTRGEETDVRIAMHTEKTVRN